MIPDPQPAKAKTAPKPSAPSSLLKALAATAVVLCATILIAYALGGTSSAPNDTTNLIPRPPFANAAQMEIQGTLVDDKDVATALAGMQLTPAEIQTLQASLGQAAAPAPAGAGGAQPAPDAQPSTSTKNRLAWVTLWDIGADSGDVLKIQTQGYAQTITLTQTPTKYAIPYPADGMIEFTAVSAKDKHAIIYGTLGWHTDVEALAHAPPSKLTINQDEDEVRVERSRVN